MNRQIDLFERDRIAAARRLDWLTFRQIGEELGVSAAQARQMNHRFHVYTRRIAQNFVDGLLLPPGQTCWPLFYSAIQYLLIDFERFREMDNLYHTLAKDFFLTPEEVDMALRRTIWYCWQPRSKGFFGQIMGSKNIPFFPDNKQFFEHAYTYAITLMEAGGRGTLKQWLRHVLI